IRQSSPAFFERLVVDLLVVMGYGGSRRDARPAGGPSRGRGGDGVIQEGRPRPGGGFPPAAKRGGTRRPPPGPGGSRPPAGSLLGQRASKGLLLTTSSFTKEAVEYARGIERKIVLVDGAELAEFMIEHGVGVADVKTYHLKRVDEDYFAGE